MTERSMIILGGMSPSCLKVLTSNIYSPASTLENKVLLLEEAVRQLTGSNFDMDPSGHYSSQVRDLGLGASTVLMGGLTGNVSIDKMAADNQGLRFNAGKPRYDLMPAEALDAIADHYRKGAEKYADRNWERGMDWGKCFASLMRHGWAWMRGEDFDEETGSHHMVAVAWNAIALYVYHVRKIGNDDRPTSTARV